MESHFCTDQYSALNNNCNHFSLKFMNAIISNDRAPVEMPSFISRLQRFGKYVERILPDHYCRSEREARDQKSNALTTDNVQTITSHRNSYVETTPHLLI
mmetsp:Transcript_32591/g.45439  ORF Transcript_32591/g.45439 Transcript_32591/m.45439 type:complete len:100 (+) Transcript_32591:67-366(+)